MNRAARLFPLGLMLGMALLSLWLNLLTMPVDNPPDNIDLKKPEYTIKQIEAKRFDEQGRLQQHLQAAQMWQLPHNPTVYLQQPKVAVYSEGVADYTVSASNGSYHKQQRIADFSDNVRWERQGRKDNTPIILLTSTLRVDSAKREASNNAPLTANHDGSRLSATGFTYKQDSGQLALLSNVRITYAP